MVLNASKSQENAHFHLIVWPGLYASWRAVVTTPIYNAVVKLYKGVVTNYGEEGLQNGRGDK